MLATKLKILFIVIVHVCFFGCESTPKNEQIDKNNSQSTTSNTRGDRSKTIEVFFAGLPPDFAAIQDAARSGLPRFLEAIPEGMEKRYGFGNRNELNDVQLGTPIRLATYSRDVLLKSNRATAPKLRLLDEWRFPIKYKDRARVFLTVAPVDSRWAAVEIGAAVLAAEIDAVLTQNKAITKPFIPVLLRLYHLKADVLLVADKLTSLENTTAFPLQSARMLNGNTKQLSAASLPASPLLQVLPMLREKSFKMELEP